MSEDTIKKCNFCRLADELNTEEIPFWSKKNENYSPYPKMVNCDSNYSPISLVSVLITLSFKY